MRACRYMSKMLEIAAILSLMALPACSSGGGDGDSTVCKEGQLGCSCRADGACDAGTCVQKVCQAPDGDLDSDAVDSDGDAESAAVCAVADWGPNGVGTMSLTLTDASRSNRALPTLVFYPTETRPDYAACEAKFVAEDTYMRYSDATICAVEGAAIKSGPYPVLIFSHGSGAQKEGYTYLEEFFASHGFLVVAIDHTGNVGFMQANPADTSESYTRLVDLRFTLDSMLAKFADAADPLYEAGDPARIAVAGHSWGGHAAIILSGFTYNYDKISQECTAGKQVDAYQCPLLDHKTEIESITPDTRVKVVISYAQDIGKAEQPGGPECYGAPGVTIPWLMFGGDKDTYLTIQEDGTDCYNKAGGAACFVELNGAGHLGYTDLGDEEGFDNTREYHLARLYSTAFLKYYLNGETTCLDTMKAAYAQDGANHKLSCR